MKFFKDWVFDLSKLPSYKAFEEPFNTVVPIDLLDAMLKETNYQGLKEIRSACSVSKNRPVGVFKQTYSNRCGLGRFYPDKGLITLKREFKHTLFNHMGWVDLDLKSCQPSIVLSVSRDPLEYPNLLRYFNEADEVKEELYQFYSNPKYPLEKTDIKDLINLILYGGGIQTWLKGLPTNKIPKTEILNPWLKGYIEECREIRDRIYILNDDIVDRVKGDLEDIEDIKKRTTSYYLGTLENHILHLAYKWLIKKGLMNHNESLPEYDGLCFLYYGNDIKQTATELTQYLVRETGFKYIKMVYKPYENVKSYEEVIPFSPVFGSNFEEMRREFEKTHAVVKNHGFYIREYDGDIVLMKKDTLKIAYADMKYEEMKNNTITEMPFITKWMSNFSRSYDTLGNSPNGDCSPNIYNLWKPFAGAELPPCEPNKKGLTEWLDLMYILCGKEQIIYDYFIKWIGALFQFPERKVGTMPVFISQQGAGKGTLKLLLEAMVGQKKVLETTQPSRDVWGNFNGQMANAYLVILNELDPKETRNADAYIKGLITDDAININAKGKDTYSIKSYHKYITFSNKDYPLNTSEDDRRNLIIYCSGDKIGNKAYFTKMNKLLDNATVKTCYDYFMSLDLTGFFEMDLPRTEYHKNLVSTFKHPVESYLDWICETTDEDTKKFARGELYSCFKTFLETTGTSCDINSSTLSFKISTILRSKGCPQAFDKKHTKTGSGHVLDLTFLRPSNAVGEDVCDCDPSPEDYLSDI